MAFDFNPTPYRAVPLDFSNLDPVGDFWKGQEVGRERQLRNDLAKLDPKDPNYLQTAAAVMMRSNPQLGAQTALAAAQQAATNSFRSQSLAEESRYHRSAEIPDSYKEWWLSNNPGKTPPWEGDTGMPPPQAAPASGVAPAQRPGELDVQSTPVQPNAGAPGQTLLPPEVSPPGQGQSYSSFRSEQKFGSPQVQEDRAFAKDIPTWESQGRAETAQNLDSLAHGIETLDASDPELSKEHGVKYTGKPVSGKMPGWRGVIGSYMPYQYGTLGTAMEADNGAGESFVSSKYPEAADVRDRHVRAVSVGMRNILGSRPAQSVIHAVIKATYNANLDPKKNDPRLRALYENIKSAAQAKDQQIAWFKSHNTLAGYSGPDPAAIINQSADEYIQSVDKGSGGATEYDYDPQTGKMVPRQ